MPNLSRLFVAPHALGPSDYPTRGTPNSASHSTKRPTESVPPWHERKAWNRFNLACTLGQSLITFRAPHDETRQDEAATLRAARELCSVFTLP